MKYDYDGYKVYDDDDIRAAIFCRSMISQQDFLDNENMISEFVSYCEHNERYCNWENTLSNNYVQLRDDLFCIGMFFNSNVRALASMPELEYCFQYSEQCGYYGGYVRLLVTTLDIDAIKCIIDCIHCCKEYPILSDDIYYSMESELIEDTINDFLQYNPEYNDRRDDIRDYLYNNGSEYACSWDYSESDMIKYLAG